MKQKKKTPKFRATAKTANGQLHLIVKQLRLELSELQEQLKAANDASWVLAGQKETLATQLSDASAKLASELGHRLAAYNERDRLRADNIRLHNALCARIGILTKPLGVC